MTETLFIGTTAIHLERVDSTNNYARSLVRDRMPVEGTVIVAQEQTHGRGQRANLWLSEPNMNITCSYVLRPVFLAAKDQFMLSAAVALAVRAVVADMLDGAEVKVKWPNDVLVDGKKIAGILIENSLRGSNLETSIVGIGLNVNQTEFPDGLSATSLKLITKNTYRMQAVLDRLNTQLEKFYLLLREGNYRTILLQLNEQLFGVGTERNMNLNGSDETVKIVGICHSGELELEHADGSRTLHQHHEIIWNLP